MAFPPRRERPGLHAGNKMNSEKVGMFMKDDEGKYSFSYDAEYAARRNPMPLSPRLPVGEKPFGDMETRVFFTNLVPEGDLYAGMCKLTRVDVSDKFGFLEKWGRECAGALSFSPDMELKPVKNGRIELSISNFYKGRRSPLSFGPDIDPGEIQPRMSLAGGQDKTPVIIEDGKIWYPVGDTMSTHILKANVQGFDASARNEVFCLHVAAELGLPVPDSFVIPVKNGAFACIKRYDRQDGCRLHQIDFCQALGILPENKYQETRSGEDYLKRMLSMTEALDAAGPGGISAAEHFAKAMCYNYLIKNTDAHAKNFSLLYRGDDERWHAEISPLYDLNSMHIYNVEPFMAMSYGGEIHYHKIRGENFIRLAENLGLDADWMVSMAADMAENIPDAANDVAKRHAVEWKNAPCYPSLVRQIAKTAGNLSRFLDAVKKPENHFCP